MRQAEENQSDFVLRWKEHFSGRKTLGHLGILSFLKTLKTPAGRAGSNRDFMLHNPDS